MATLKQKPNGIYFLDVQVPDGMGGLRRSRVGLDTRDKATAEAHRRDWLAGVHPKHPAMGGVVAPKGAVPLNDSSTRAKLDSPLVSTWLLSCLEDEDVWGNCKADATHRSNVRIITRLIDGDLQIGQLTTGHIEQLRADLRDTCGYAPASQRKLLGTLSAAARHAVRKGHLKHLPEFPTIKFRNQRDRVITLDEEAVMFECIRQRRIDEPLRAWWHFEKLMVLLLQTGVRLSEALLAGPSWVKRKRWLDNATGEDCEGVWLGIPRTTIYNGKQVEVTKNGKPRDVPLTAAALEILPELTARIEGTRWFPWNLGSSGPLYLLQAIRGDMEKRGYQFGDVVLHTARHTCATRLAEGGLDLLALRDWLGHSDIKITAGTYLHLMNSHVWRGVAVLNRYGSIGAAEEKQDDPAAKCSMPDALPTGTDRAESGVAHLH